MLDKRLWFVTGKGGVGKSTVTAALADSMARTGHRTLVLEMDSFSAMADLLGVEAPQHEPVRVRDGLYVANLDTSDCLVNSFVRFLPSQRLVRTLLNNRVARLFFDTAPSVNEFVLLDQVQDYLDGEVEGAPHFDRILVDLPAAGHAVTFLSVPDRLAELIGVGKIAKRARLIGETIRDTSRTGVAAVCLPEEMPVNETVELESGIEEVANRSLTCVFLNMMHQLPFDNSDRELFESVLKRTGIIDADTDPSERATAIKKILTGNSLALDWYDRDQEYSEMLEQKIEKAPIFELPVVYETDETEVIELLSARIEGHELKN